MIEFWSHTTQLELETCPPHAPLAKKGGPMSGGGGLLSGGPKTSGLSTAQLIKSMMLCFTSSQKLLSWCK